MSSIVLPTVTLSPVSSDPANAKPRGPHLEPDPLIKKHELHWRVSLESYERPRLEKIGAWTLIYEDKETCMYGLHRKVIIGFRGTDEPKDLYDDTLITLGKNFPRAQQAIKFLLRLRELNSNITIYLTGHSLGGAIAREAGNKLRIQTVTFNAAAPPSFPATSQSWQTDYHVMFDIVSAWQEPNTIRIDKGYYPLSSPFFTMVPHTWLYHMYSGILPAHSLTNFSNETPGRKVTACEENKKLNKWFLSLPSTGRKYLLTVLFEVNGKFVQTIPQVK